MNKINELKAGVNWNFEGTINEAYPLRYPYMCFECKSKGHSTVPIHKCPNCAAEQTAIKAKGLWLQKLQTVKVKDETGEILMDFWNEDTANIIPGKKIRVINGYIKNVNSVNIASKGMYGRIEWQ